ncbi:23295_t:CDS:2 [Gigaspora rosea]|nr:23295_t:CDS:2 [Gigaspora rosea]
MPPKVSSSREYLQSKPVTRKTRNTTKKSTQIEPDVSEHLQMSKRPRKSNQVKENVNLDLENTSLDNVQSNIHIERYQQSRSPSVEPQTHSPFDAIIYQHKAPLQVNRRSTNSCAQSIEPRIDSFPERSNQRLSNQNHHLVEDESSLPLQMNKDESSEDEIFSSFGQNYNSNSLKELSHSNIQSNMQNVNSYLDIQSGLTTSSVKNCLFFQDETHLIRWLEERKDIVLQVLTSICSSPPIISNQVSSNSTPNLAKILSEQSRILFLWTRSYYGSINQEDSDQDMSSCNLYDTDNMEFDQEFDNNLDYSNLESIYENEFSDNINSDNLDNEYEPISNNMDDEPKTFDRTKPNINWNHESPYSLFGNFTNMVI